MKKTILITGATGFIGKHLLEEKFLDMYNIKLMTRNKKAMLSNLYPQYEIIEADLNNLTQIIAACKGVDVVINIAAEVRNTQQLNKTNIEGSNNLAQAIVLNKVSHLIHLSSVGVVGEQFCATTKIVTEESSCKPKNEYERTKLLSEKIFIDAQQSNDFILNIIRPTNVYGENHPLNALLTLLKYVKDEKLLLYTSTSCVNYVYVKDLTHFIGKLIEVNKNIGVINFGNTTKLKQFYKQIQSLLQSKNNYFKLPVILIKFIDLFKINLLIPVSNAVVYDDSKLKQFYSYPYGEIEGLKRTIENYTQKKLL